MVWKKDKIFKLKVKINKKISIVKKKKFIYV